MDVVEKIKKIKEEKNAVILAHYYVNAEVQKIADYIGDSYYLAKVAKKTDADIIVFCGVSFMGESAKILNPDKKVLMPDMSADCAMAHMADVEKIKALREEYKDLAVVCYINSTAKLKCHSDVCVTSANAVKIVRELPNENIFFIPDENLGRYVKEQVPEKNVILNDGYCPVHKKMNANAVLKEKSMYPEALILAHPECTKEILDLADYIGSTTGIIEYTKKSEAKEFIICTEIGVKYSLENECPDKKFYFADTSWICSDMKLNTLENVLKVLETENNEVEVTDELRSGSLKPLERMLELAK